MNNVRKLKRKYARTMVWAKSAKYAAGFAVGTVVINLSEEAAGALSVMAFGLCVGGIWLEEYSAREIQSEIDELEDRPP
ncbi:MAG: hypothetical protein C9356_15105 [Oleiphilus sp.]|nr:MAG: hypothetical protein C9356_15105 [Oleiphilus sp.]